MRALRLPGAMSSAAHGGPGPWPDALRLLVLDDAATALPDPSASEVAAAMLALQRP